jgi:hypothetical protein
MLRVSDSPTHRLNRPDTTAIHQCLRESRHRKEQCYLVVGFLREPGRIVVVPAAAALKARRIRSDKGGLAWED